MALTLKTDKQVQLIVSSVRKVMQTGDIDNLTKQAYDFIMLGSGFIAHFNLHGFRAEYSNVEDLRNALLANQRYNQWSNFRPGERDYEYYMQKKEIYNQICQVCKTHNFQSELAFCS